MPPREAIAYFRDAYRAADDIVMDTIGLSEDTYLGLRMHRRATERNFQILGEALRQIQKLDPELLAGIEHVQDIIGLRNIVVHAYFDLDHRRLYRIIQGHLPALIEQLRASIAGDVNEVDED